MDRQDRHKEKIRVLHLFFTPQNHDDFGNKLLTIWYYNILTFYAINPFVFTINKVLFYWSWTYLPDSLRIQSNLEPDSQYQIWHQHKVEAVPSPTISDHGQYTYPKVFDTDSSKPFLQCMTVDILNNETLASYHLACKDTTHALAISTHPRLKVTRVSFWHMNLIGRDCASNKTKKFHLKLEE